MDILRTDFDTPWKDILESFFEMFLRYCYPKIAAEIDWSRNYELLDKELSSISPDAEIGNRIADKLFKVWRINGDETWVLLHIEVQGDQKARFEERMFIYYYRLFDRYQKPIVSLAILTDDSFNWRPNCYQQKLWGCEIDFKFLIIKVLDYNERRTELEKCNNPFATVFLAQLESLRTKQNMLERKQRKLALTKTLYQKGYNKRQILNLYTFIDWIITLPEPIALEYNEELIKFEEQQKMAYITTAERFGIEKGLKQGRAEGRSAGLAEGQTKGELLLLQRQLARKFGSVPSNYLERLQQANAEQLLEWGDKILDAKTLSEVFG